MVGVFLKLLGTDLDHVVYIQSLAVYIWWSCQNFTLLIGHHWLLGLRQVLVDVYAQRVGLLLFDSHLLCLVLLIRNVRVLGRVVLQGFPRCRLVDKKLSVVSVFVLRVSFGRWPKVELSWGQTFVHAQVLPELRGNLVFHCLKSNSKINVF